MLVFYSYTRLLFFLRKVNLSILQLQILHFFLKYKHSLIAIPNKIIWCI